MKTLSLIVLVLSFTFTTPATARDMDNKYSAQGDKSCGQWVNFRNGGGWEHAAVIGWIAGYIAAYNRQTPDVYNITGSTDFDNVLLWMDKYCRENPLSNLATGMDDLTNELWPNRKRTKND